MLQVIILQMCFFVLVLFCFCFFFFFPFCIILSLTYRMKKLASPFLFLFVMSNVNVQEIWRCDLEASLFLYLMQYNLPSSFELLLIR